MGGQTSKAHGARGVRGVRTFLIAKNAPYTHIDFSCNKYFSMCKIVLLAVRESAPAIAATISCTIIT